MCQNLNVHLLLGALKTHAYGILRHITSENTVANIDRHGKKGIGIIVTILI